MEEEKKLRFLLQSKKITPTEKCLSLSIEKGYHKIVGMLLKDGRIDPIKYIDLAISNQKQKNY